MKVSTNAMRMVIGRMVCMPLWDLLSEVRFIESKEMCPTSRLVFPSQNPCMGPIYCPAGCNVGCPAGSNVGCSAGSNVDCPAGCNVGCPAGPKSAIKIRLIRLIINEKKKKNIFNVLPWVIIYEKLHDIHFTGIYITYKESDSPWWGLNQGPLDSASWMILGKWKCFSMLKCFEKPVRTC